MLKEGRNREKAVRKNRNLFTRNKLCGVGKETFRIEFSRILFPTFDPLLLLSSLLLFWGNEGDTFPLRGTKDEARIFHDEKDRMNAVVKSEKLSRLSDC